jgi:hypothetical protein
VAVAPLRKPLPVTVRAKAALPATTLDGFRLVMLGVGFTVTTVTVGLVAAATEALFGATEALFGKKRNSYCPGVGGIVTVHVFEVVPGSVFTATLCSGARRGRADERQCDRVRGIARRIAPASPVREFGMRNRASLSRRGSREQLPSAR